MVRYSGLSSQPEQCQKEVKKLTLTITEKGSSVHSSSVKTSIPTNPSDLSPETTSSSIGALTQKGANIEQVLTALHWPQRMLSTVKAFAGTSDKFMQKLKLCTSSEKLRDFWAKLVVSINKTK